MNRRDEMVALADRIDVLREYGTSAILNPDSAKMVVEALRSAQAEPGYVVKPLEWVDTKQRGFMQKRYYAVSGPLRHTCHPLDGQDGGFFEHYSIEERPRKPQPWLLVYWVGNSGTSGVNKSFDTIAAAKAAAQADHEQRIRSAITATVGTAEPGYVAGFEACRDALEQLAKCDGSSSNVASAEILAARVQHIAKAALAALPAPATADAGWQPIETAPHNTRVLLAWRDWRDDAWLMEVGSATAGQRFDNGCSNLSQHGSATHWMPLPAAPTKRSATDPATPPEGEEVTAEELEQHLFGMWDDLSTTFKDDARALLSTYKITKRSAT